MEKWKVSKKEMEEIIKESVEEVKKVSYELEKKQKQCAHSLE